MRAFTPYYLVVSIADNRKIRKHIFPSEQFCVGESGRQIEIYCGEIFQLNVDGIFLHHIFTKYPGGLGKLQTSKLLSFKMKSLSLIKLPTFWTAFIIKEFLELNQHSH